MQCLVIVALSVAGVDDVAALRSARVALPLLGRQPAPAKRHFVGADRLAPGHQFHEVVLFEDQNGVGLLRRRWLRGR